MNWLGSRGIPFAFLIDFEAKTPQLFKAGETAEKIFWETPVFSNLPESTQTTKLKKWITQPVSFETYKKGFELVQHHIHNGNTYLLNFTQPTLIDCNLSVNDIFHISSAPYKVLLKNRFVCFSPESFARIKTES